MYFYKILVFAAIFILLIIAFRLIIHFYFCRRISPRYPAKKLKGCPIWTHAEKIDSEESAENFGIQ
ncbi:MAG TPA: hypothetical protein DCQ14_05375 [Firmicutes bacterium]|nr:hypothetical protein [Bacillota bacterium]